MSSQSYSLTILDAAVTALPRGGSEIRVRYEGHKGPGEVRRMIADTELATILAGCEMLAQTIFHEEFRLNSHVELSFALEDENGLRLWHTRPSLYVKCPLTMTMKWSCHHLSQSYKTMTTLGVIELPEETPLTGNAIGANDTAKVIMDSMASGIEFMGNVMLMRNTIDHDAEARRAMAAGQ